MATTNKLGTVKLGNMAPPIPAPPAKQKRTPEQERAWLLRNNTPEEEAWMREHPILSKLMPDPWVMRAQEYTNEQQQKVATTPMFGSLAESVRSNKANYRTASGAPDPVSYGLAQSMGETVDTMQTPLGLSTAGLLAIGGGFIPQVALRFLNAGMTFLGLTKLAQDVPEAVDAFNRGDDELGWKLVGDSGVDVGMAAIGAKDAVNLTKSTSRAAAALAKRVAQDESGFIIIRFFDDTGKKLGERYVDKLANITASGVKPRGYIRDATRAEIVYEAPSVPKDASNELGMARFALEEAGVDPNRPGNIVIKKREPTGPGGRMVEVEVDAPAMVEAYPVVRRGPTAKARERTPSGVPAAADYRGLTKKERDLQDAQNRLVSNMVSASNTEPVRTALGMKSWSETHSRANVKAAPKSVPAAKATAQKAEAAATVETPAEPLAIPAHQAAQTQPLQPIPAHAPTVPTTYREYRRALEDAMPHLSDEVIDTMARAAVARQGEVAAPAAAQPSAKSVTISTPNPNPTVVDISKPSGRAPIDTEHYKKTMERLENKDLPPVPEPPTVPQMDAQQAEKNAVQQSFTSSELFNKPAPEQPIPPPPEPPARNVTLRSVKDGEVVDKTVNVAKVYQPRAPSPKESKGTPAPTVAGKGMTREQIKDRLIKVLTNKEKAIRVRGFGHLKENVNGTDLFTYYPNTNWRGDWSKVTEETLPMVHLDDIIQSMSPVKGEVELTSAKLGKKDPEFRRVWGEGGGEVYLEGEKQFTNVQVGNKIKELKKLINNPKTTPTAKADAEMRLEAIERHRHKTFGSLQTQQISGSKDYNWTRPKQRSHGGSEEEWDDYVARSLSEAEGYGTLRGGNRRDMQEQLVEAASEAVDPITGERGQYIDDLDQLASEVSIGSSDWMRTGSTLEAREALRKQLTAEGKDIPDWLKKPERLAKRIYNVYPEETTTAASRPSQFPGSEYGTRPQPAHEVFPQTQAERARMEAGVTEASQASRQPRTTRTGAQLPGRISSEAPSSIVDTVVDKKHRAKTYESTVKGGGTDYTTPYTFAEYDTLWKNLQDTGVGGSAKKVGRPIETIPRGTVESMIDAFKKQAEEAKTAAAAAEKRHLPSEATALRNREADYRGRAAKLERLKSRAGTVAPPSKVPEDPLYQGQTTEARQREGATSPRVIRGSTDTTTMGQFRTPKEAEEFMDLSTRRVRKSQLESKILDLKNRINKTQASPTRDRLEERLKVLQEEYKNLPKDIALVRPIPPPPTTAAMA